MVSSNGIRVMIPSQITDDDEGPSHRPRVAAAGGQALFELGGLSDSRPGPGLRTESHGRPIAETGLGAAAAAEVRSAPTVTAPSLA